MRTVPAYLTTLAPRGSRSHSSRKKLILVSQRNLRPLRGNILHCPRFVLASRRPVALIEPAIKLTCLQTSVAPARTTPTRNEQVSGFLEDCGDEGLGRIYFGSEASAITAGDAGVRKSVANAERDKR